MVEVFGYSEPHGERLGEDDGCGCLRVRFERLRDDIGICFIVELYVIYVRRRRAVIIIRRNNRRLATVDTRLHEKLQDCGPQTSSDFCLQRRHVADA